jgi:hypothetical protein
MNTMILLIKIDDINSYKSRDLIPLECHLCHKCFHKEQHYVKNALKDTRQLKYCSVKCQQLSQITTKKTKCPQCKKNVFQQPFHAAKYKHRFCSNTCSGIYNSSHKTTGCRRSKLEQWLEQKLPEIYPTLEILYNDRTAILAELDIYIPSLKLAFELNGVFHYEQIYESTPLSDVQHRDKNKIICCFKEGIELCVIDTTPLNYFKEDKAKKFLDIITNIINQSLKIGRSS